MAIVAGDWARGLVQTLGWLLIVFLASSVFYLAVRVSLWVLERVHEGLGL